MRIFILTIEEPFYLPGFFGKIMDKYASCILGVGIVPLSPKIFMQHLHVQFQLYGFWGFLRYIWLYIAAKILDLSGVSFRKRRFFSVRRTARHYHIPVYKIKSPNEASFLTFLRGLNLDIILCQVSSVLSKELLGIAKYGCLNRHSSLLPKYRGLYPVFWAMLNNEKETGVTVYRMAEAIDTGGLISQAAVKIGADDTCHDLYRRTFDAGAELILEVLKTGNTQIKRALEAQEKYYSYPDKQVIARFGGLGKKIGFPALRA